jgi:hypothetical protein
VSTIAISRLRTGGEAEHGDRAKPHHQPGGLGRRREVERLHDPLLVRQHEQQREDHADHQEVGDDEDSQHDVREGERGGRRSWPGHVRVTSVFIE